MVRIATENECYGNEMHGFAELGIGLDDEAEDPHRNICGKAVRGDTNGDPANGSPEDLPEGDGIGETGGDSPRT